MRRFIRKKFFHFLRNIYSTNFQRSALLSYLTDPFYREKNISHSAFLEIEILGEIVRDLEYNVDAVMFTYEGKINYKKYDLIIGFGTPFGGGFHSKEGESALKVLYLTGALNIFRQMERIKYLRERKGRGVIPRRNYHYKFMQESISLADAVIVTGNDWTMNTVTPYNREVFGVSLPVHVKSIYCPDLEVKNYTRAKNTYLWFGSSGAVHKGLDILLDLFSGLNGYCLHVCGPVDVESDFMEIYKEELFNKENIHFHKFVKVDSDLFKKIIDETAFVIFPTCCEGTSGSVLTCMAAGLIPVVTEASGITVKDFGFQLEDYKIEYLREVLMGLSVIDDNSLKEKSKKSAHFARTLHSPEAYREEVTEILKEILSQAGRRKVEK